MAMLPATFDELADLTWALANDRLDAAGASRLRQLLDADAANRRVYIKLTNQFAALDWEAGESARHNSESRQHAESGLSDDAAAAQSVRPTGVCQRAAEKAEGSGAGVAYPSFVSGPIPLSSSPLGSFGGVLLVYAMVAVVLGIGAVAAWVWTSAAGRSPAPLAQQGTQQVTGTRQAGRPDSPVPAPGGPTTTAPGVARHPAAAETTAAVDATAETRSTGQSLVPVMIYITDDAGKGAAFPVPAGGEARRGQGGLPPLPTGLPDAGGQWNLRIGQLTDSGSKVLRCIIKMWPENAGDAEPVASEKLGGEPVLDLVARRLRAEICDVALRNDKLTRRDMPKQERDRRLAAMYRFAAATGDADHFQLPEFVATTIATICRAKGAAAGAEAGAAADPAASSHDGRRCTSRVAFRVAEPLPAGAELWCCLYTPHRLSVARLNGKTLPAAQRAGGKNEPISEGQISEFRVTSGLAVADNTLELDVDDFSPAATRKSGPPRFLLALGVFWVAAVSPPEAVASPAGAAGDTAIRHPADRGQPQEKSGNQ